MPQLHPTRRTGRRLLTTGLLGAVAVLGTPAVASAETPLDQVPVVGDLIPDTGTDPGAGTDPDAGTAPVPGAGEVEDAISAGAECFTTAGADLQVAITGLGTGLTSALVGLLGDSPIPLPVDGEGDAAGVIALDQADLEEVLAGGAEDLTMVVTVIVDGVRQVVQVVVDLAECLAALIPAPAPASPTTVVPALPAAPTTEAPAPAPAVTTSAAPTQAVAYPGYAPTGGAPTEDGGAPLGLLGLGALTAVTGAGAWWLRARRGVAG